MQPFNVVQVVACKAMQDAFDSLLDAHNKEVKGLRDQVEELEQSLVRMQSLVPSAKCDGAGSASGRSRGREPHEMKDVFDSSPNDDSCDEHPIELNGSKEAKMDEGHAVDSRMPLNGSKEAKEVDRSHITVRSEPSIRSYSVQRQDAVRRKSTRSVRSLDHDRHTAVVGDKKSRDSVAAEARRITQQALNMMPPAQRRIRLVSRTRTRDNKQDRPYLQNIVEHPLFESGCAFLIVVNSFLVGFDVEWYTTHDTPNISVEIAGHVCSAGFLIELLLRLKAYKLGFFRGESVLWNVFDAILVTMSIVEVLIQSQVDSAAGTASIGSGLKTVKMLRIIRVFRVFRFFKELSLLALMIIDSMKALVWALVMLSIILYVFAICFTVNATEYIKTSDAVLEANFHQVYTMFGSIPKTVYSLLQAMLGGVSWGVMSDALLQVGWPLAGLFFFYVSFVMLAVLNIITGVFVDNAVETAKSQRDVLVQKEFELKERYLAELRELFQKMDDDGSGTLTMEEIKEYCTDPRVMSYFQALGLDPHDTERLFRLIDDDGDGDVNVDEFLAGCMRLKGGARSIDVHQLLTECKRLDQHFERLEKKVADLTFRVNKKALLDSFVVHSH